MAQVHDVGGMSPRCLPLLGYMTAATIVLATLASVLLSPMPAPLPGSAGSAGKFDELAAKVAAAGALRDLVSLLVTLSLGLTAVVGFTLRDAFAKVDGWAATNAVLMALFVSLLALIMKHAYHAYAMIAGQLESGHLFVARVAELYEEQALFVLLCAVTVAAIIAIRIMQGFRNA